MAEKVSMNETQRNLGEIWITFTVQNCISEEDSRTVTNFLVQRDSLSNSPTFVYELLSFTFPNGSPDNELIQNISLLAGSLSPEQQQMIVDISFDSESHNHHHNMNFTLEKVKVEDFEVREKCVICLEELASGILIGRGYERKV